MKKTVNNNNTSTMSEFVKRFDRLFEDIFGNSEETLKELRKKHKTNRGQHNE